MTEAPDKPDKVNVLLVDDQPAKLMAYEVILRDLGENLIKASSGREALERLLKTDIAIVLIDVCMPELDGFQLAAMIRDHPRFEKTAIIFISAIHLSDVDRLRGYEMGAVDYVPVPVVPEVLRAKVKVFAELHRKTRQLEKLNAELEQRVGRRTADLAASNERVIESEQRRTLALAAGQMGSWDFDAATGQWAWDEGQYRIFGIDRKSFPLTPGSIRTLIHPEDWQRLREKTQRLSPDDCTYQGEFRVLRANGEIRWCIGTTAATFDDGGRMTRLGGVTVDITERKQAEERQALLAREVDHRARNALAVIQSLVRLTRGKSIEDYKESVEGRITALARAHTLLSESRWSGADLSVLVAEELAPYRSTQADRIVALGPSVSLQPAMAQTLALAIHELATNAAKYGALSVATGTLHVNWNVVAGTLLLQWNESGAQTVAPLSAQGFGMKLIGTSIDQQLCGRVTFDWAPGGLRCHIAIPLSRPANFVDIRRGAPEAGRPSPGAARFGAPCVLLVEDEALVAMMMREFLTELGCAITGPYSSTAAALAAAKSDEAIDFAILDINLGDELVYPVADYLVSRGVPFVFVTGYDVDSVDERFRHVAVLQKPVDQESLRRIFPVELLAPETAGTAESDVLPLRAVKL